MKTGNLQRRIIIMTILWAIFVCAGVGMFAWYDVRLSLQSVAPATLPATTRILSPTTTPTVAMFLHPRCPCSRASLTEFAHVVRDFQAQATFRIIFFKPASQGLSWVQEDNLYAKALSLQSSYPTTLNISIDEAGKEAERVHAETSGFVVAYNAHGDLLFSGGITASRGHEGVSAGEIILGDALRQALATRNLGTQNARYSISSGAQAASAPTFGCAILNNANEQNNP